MALQVEMLEVTERPDADAELQHGRHSLLMLRDSYGACSPAVTLVLSRKPAGLPALARGACIGVVPCIQLTGQVLSTQSQRHRSQWSDAPLYVSVPSRAISADPALPGRPALLPSQRQHCCRQFTGTRRHKRCVTAALSLPCF